MTSLRGIATVAGFEFRRVFKPKDIVITLVMFCCGALFFAWLRSMDEPAVKAPVTVIGDAFELANADHLPFNFLPAPAETITEAQARRQVDAGEMGTVVVLRALDDVEIIVQDEVPSWYPQLVATVDEARMATRVKRSGLSPTQLSEIFDRTPVGLSSTAQVDVAAKSRLHLLAALCLGGMIMGLFVGSVHLFTGITGEKQNHITESVLSAIRVQTWIDGKCVGLTLVAFAGLLSLSISGLIANQVYGIFHEPMTLPVDVADPALFAGFLLLSLLGFLMWFAFFAAIAATIDDPNTSSRGMFMFLPAFATGLAFMGIDKPEAAWYRVQSIFPLTSPGAMVVRMVKGDPAVWEIALAVLLLIAATWLFRRMAAKIFAMAMLMRGKELAWREVWRAFTTPA